MLRCVGWLLPSMHAEPQARAALQALRGAEYLTLSLVAKLRLLRALGEAYLEALGYVETG
jgi:hypothetical protein